MIFQQCLLCSAFNNQINSASLSLARRKLQFKALLYQVMQKRGQCQCGSTIVIPNSECLYECGNCRSKGYFLCHILQQPADPMLMRCKTCKIAYSVFKCPQCQGTGVIKQFKSGQSYGCLCGFNATFVTCNLCTALLCLPPRKNYENTKINCKKCSNQFKYFLCKDCKECNYIKPTQSSSSFLKCFNQNCKSSKPGLFQQSAKNKNSNTNKWNACRICLKAQAVMINSQCLHLSICENCFSQNKKMSCPICKGDGQRYYKVHFQ